jgi:hypothetical protein
VDVSKKTKQQQPFTRKNKMEKQSKENKTQQQDIILY